MSCPLCESLSATRYSEDKFRQYLLCGNCTLVYVPRDSILPFREEADRYEAHQNDDGEPDYVAYLTRIVDGIRPRLPKPKFLFSKPLRGLDFGCGKTTLLEKLFSAHDVEVDSYDLYFHPNESVWNRKYDFIVLSEVIEHLSDPRGVMLRLSKVLKGSGKFFIKTKPYPADPAVFDQWFYKRDMTHVQFFNHESLSQLAKLLKMAGPHKLGDDIFEFY